MFPLFFFGSAFLTILVIFLVIFLAICIFLYIIRVKPYKGIYYSPPYHPILGHVFHLHSNMPRHCDNLVAHANRTLALGFSCHQLCIPFQNPLIHILTPELIEYVLKTNFESFEKGDRIKSRFGEILGNGIFNSDGKLWRNQRKVASHMFSHRILQEKMSSVFIEHSKVFLSILEEKSNQNQNNNPSNNEEYFDLQSLFNRFTLDCIGEIAFGVDFHSLELLNPPEFVNSFDSAQEIVAARFITPRPMVSLLRLFNIGSEKNFHIHINRINQFVLKLIDERLEKLNKSKEHINNNNNNQELDIGDDLLSLFIIDSFKRNEIIDRIYLRDLALNFILAGRDTTASALSHMFYYLDRNIGVQSKLLSELYLSLESNGNSIDSDITADTVKSLPYADAVFNEVCRLSSPVPCNTKVCVKSCKFPDGTEIPAGANILWCPYVLNRLSNIWGDKSMEFIPERWLMEINDGNNENNEEKEAEEEECKENTTTNSNNTARKLNIHKNDKFIDYNPTKQYKIRPVTNYEYSSFNAGPRLCLGKGMAFLEAKILSSNILRNYQIHVQDGFHPGVKFSITMPFVDGLPVKVTKRKQL